MQKPDQRQVLKMFINQQFQQYPDILTKERILHSKGVADFIYCYCKANHVNNERIHELYITALLHERRYESILSRYDSNDKRLKDVNKIIDYLRIHFPEYDGNAIA